MREITNFLPFDIGNYGANDRGEILPIVVRQRYCVYMTVHVLGALADSKLGTTIYGTLSSVYTLKPAAHEATFLGSLQATGLAVWRAAHGAMPLRRVCGYNTSRLPHHQQ
jgi:hypothetical protein